MKNIKILISAFLLCSTLAAQTPPPPNLQPGEHWTNLWSVAYDYQSNGSVRYLVQDPANQNKWCAILMAQHDSNSTGSVERYTYYSYTEDGGITWDPEVLTNAVSHGFPCITLSNGIPVIADHLSSTIGIFVYKDVIFGGFSFASIPGTPLPGPPIPIWPHVAGASNGNITFAGSPNPGPFSLSWSTYNGSSWSSLSINEAISGPSGNYDLAANSTGRVAMIGTNYDNSFLNNLGSAIYRLESLDNGSTFGAATITIPTISFGTETLCASVVGGFQSVYVGNDLHIVAAVYQISINVFPNTYTTQYIEPRIYHWSQATGLNLVASKANIPALSDTITSVNIVPLCQPTITITQSGKLFCAFTVYLYGNTQVAQNGDIVNAGEIFYCGSQDNGSTWSYPVNITNTPNIEEKHPSLAPRSSSDSLNIYYIRDMRAGSWVTVPGWGKAPVYGIYYSRNTPLLPLPPVLLSPSNNSSYISLTPLLSWNASTSATSYGIQISRNTGFTNLVTEQLNLPSTQYQVPAMTLNYDSVYYWRANSTNPQGTSPWSAAWSFRTTTFLPPAPVLVSPPNGALQIPLTPTLDWNDAPTATSYAVQLSADSNFSTTLVNEVNLSISEYTVQPGILSIGTSYYWRVSSSNANGTGPWSAVSKFTTVTFALAPVLVSPANGAMNVSLTPTLDWNNVAGAVLYRVQVATDLNFSTIILDEMNLTQSQYSVPPPLLTYNSLYFWRANATNSIGTGPWSTVWNFRTIMMVGLNQSSEQIPTEYKLFNNYPNPFNPVTKIRFNLPKAGFTYLIIYDNNGRELERKVNQTLNAGSYELEFSAEVHQLSSGIYFYKLISDDFIETKKMLLIK